MLLFIGGPEIVMVVLIALLLFGADQMPDFFKTFYKGLTEVRKATDEIKRELIENSQEFKQDLLETKEHLEEEVGILNKEVRSVVYDQSGEIVKDHQYQSDDSDEEKTESDKIDNESVSEVTDDSIYPELKDDKSNEH